MHTLTMQFVNITELKKTFWDNLCLNSILKLCGHEQERWREMLFFFQITSEKNEISARCRWWISPPLVTTNLGCCRVTWPQRRPGDGPPPSGPSAPSHTAGTSPGRFRPAGPEEEGRGCGCAPSCPVSLSSLWMCLYLTGQNNWEAKRNWVTYSFYW